MVEFSPLAPATLASGDRQIFRISPLIRLTLLLLYLALMGPLPFLAQVTQSDVSPQLMAAGIGLGGLGLYGALGQRVEVDDQGIRVTYPAWIRWLFRGGWQLPWREAQALKPRSTGQGGIVYYFVGANQQVYLLPMRVAGFAQLVQLVETYTGIDTQDVKPLAQPWMYFILLGFTLLLLLVDAWTITTALQMA
ncbi:hypothetical protein IQ265_02190 [Nodosilinea sp. LEGE 06152]|uniref:hypothetical protein n=1 Tax=Nodosilinea sp. LEGE 06152 TaxID=2777966 RepID=UPI001882F2C3|nr:hypothetical protein [Nodosilinea sp. LEGE 06152]MBE9155652.1 hypothetical protein [Nodosilinea sp. LEGE 06152]